MKKKIQDLKNIDPKKLKIIFLSSTLVLSGALAGIIAVNAWFTGQKSMQTVTKIESPTVLVLGSGNRESIQRLDLGDIDAEPADELNETVHRKRYVFSVSSPETGITGYVIQLAHTTNIPFRYRIYSADDSQEDTSFDEKKEDKDYIVVPYESIGGNTIEYGFKRDIASADSKAKYNIFLQIMNPETESSELLADQKDYSHTYDDYENVQKNAKPVYLKSPAISNATSLPFLHNYILEIEWETGNGNDKAFNNKETDMVYLMAVTV